jgi:hypothetical protein
MGSVCRSARSQTGRRRWVLPVAAAAGVALAPLLVSVAVLAGGAGRGAAALGLQTEHVRISLRPRTVAPYEWATVEVAGLAEASAVEVRLAGASGIRGTLLPWITLHRRSVTWAGRLPQPVLAGIYPIELRSRPARPVVLAGAEYLRVYWEGTSKRPLFPSPEQAVEWWVHQADGTLLAIRRWPRTAIDHRLVRLHRLFVVAYRPRGPQPSGDRLGAWITTVRDGDGGNWRVLEVGVTPP